MKLWWAEEVAPMDWRAYQRLSATVPTREEREATARLQEETRELLRRREPGAVIPVER